MAGTAFAAVDPPPGTPKFLVLPFKDPGVAISQGWYYYNSEPGLSCAYPYDLPGARRHCATDFNKRIGGVKVTFPVLAAASGTARKGSGGATGTYLSIEHVAPNGARFCTRYLHLDPTRPIVTGPVVQGQQVAWAGKSGTRSIHLHWDVRPGSCSSSISNRVDPFDIGGPLLRQGIAPIKDWYPGHPRFSGCGPNALVMGC